MAAAAQMFLLGMLITATTITATTTTTTTTTANSNSNSTRCPKKCDVGSGLQTCDEILSTSDETCSSLSKRGCNCAGCQCATSLLRGDGGSSDGSPATSTAGVILIVFGSLGIVVSLVLFGVACSQRNKKTGKALAIYCQFGIAGIAFAVASPLCFLLPGIILFVVSNE